MSATTPNPISIIGIFHRSIDCRPSDEAINMPAMTMVFNVADPAMLEAMKEGDAIEFVADRVRGKLTITDVK